MVTLSAVDDLDLAPVLVTSILRVRGSHSVMRAGADDSPLTPPDRADAGGRISIRRISARARETISWIVRCSAPP